VFKVVFVAVLAVVVGSGVVAAQDLSTIGGPRENPPAGYKSAKYIDSRGCVFLRAGFGAKANWVPLIGANRKVQCGYAPTAARSDSIALASPAPTAKPMRNSGAPMDTVASLTTAPRVQSRQPQGATVPQSSYLPAPVTNLPAPRVVAPIRLANATPAPVPQARVVTAANGQLGCSGATPVPQRLRLTTGGTVVVCTRGDSTLEGLRSPTYPAGTRPGAAFDDSVVVTQSRQNPTALPVTAPRVTVPKGYRLAWTDDRLNHQRGVGTAEGQAMQDQVWTREIPAKLVSTEKTARMPAERVQSRITVSTKSNATAPRPAAPTVGRSGIYVQVGTFGQPANASATAARLAGLGLPVARQKISKGGKALQIVLAGPFGSPSDAQFALRAARGAGFGDAFVR
jgi:hypothetical protein